MSVLGNDRPVLDLLTPADRQKFVESGSGAVYRTGDVLIAEGECTDHVVILCAGHATVSVDTEQGSRLVLAIRAPGDIVGELSALDGQPRSATVTALVPTTAVVVPGARFSDFLAHRPAAARVIMQTLGARLRDADSARRSLVSLSLLQRVARVLDELVEGAGRPCAEGIEINLPLPQHELAALVGATREGTAKALAILRTGGAVLTRPRRTVIVDRDLLRALAEV